MKGHCINNAAGLTARIKYTLASRPCRDSSQLCVVVAFLMHHACARAVNNGFGILSAPQCSSLVRKPPMKCNVFVSGTASKRHVTPGMACPNQPPQQVCLCNTLPSRWPQRLTVECVWYCQHLLQRQPVVLAVSHVHHVLGLLFDPMRGCTEGAGRLRVRRIGREGQSGTVRAADHLIAVRSLLGHIGWG